MLESDYFHNYFTISVLSGSCRRKVSKLTTPHWLESLSHKQGRQSKPVMTRGSRKTWHFSGSFSLWFFYGSSCNFKPATINNSHLWVIEPWWTRPWRLLGPEARILDDPVIKKDLSSTFVSKNYSTSALEGTARGLVVAVGDSTVVGKIAGLTSGLETGPTPIAKELSHFIHIITGKTTYLAYTAIYFSLIYFRLFKHF